MSFRNTSITPKAIDMGRSKLSKDSFQITCSQILQKLLKRCHVLYCKMFPTDLYKNHGRINIQELYKTWCNKHIFNSSFILKN